MSHNLTINNLSINDFTDFTTIHIGNVVAKIGNANPTAYHVRLDLKLEPISIDADLSNVTIQIS